MRRCGTIDHSFRDGKDGERTAGSESTSIELTQTLDTMLHQILNQALVAVSAKAGSLMLVDDKQGILQIKARLGEPRPGRMTERVFRTDFGRPEDGSVAGYVVQTKQSCLCRDVSRDVRFARSRTGHSFVSLLSVPIIHEGRVLAVINADSVEPGYFDETHVQELEEVARRVASPIAERMSIIDALAEVGVELTRLPREGGVRPVLEKIADLAVRSLGADVVTLYEYDQEKDQFLVEGTGPTIAGAISDRRPMQREVHEGDVPWTVVKYRRSGFYADVSSQEFLTEDMSRSGHPPRPRFVAREGIRSAAALLLPFRAAETPSEEVVGVMFANYRSPHSFNIDEISALSTFADYAAVAILNARHEEKRRAEQMHLVESMSATFAHRMGNLVGPIRATVQLLRESVGADDERTTRQLNQLERDSDLLLELAGRLVRRFEQPGGAFERAPTDVRALLEEEVQRVRLDEEGLEVVADIAPDLPPVSSVDFELRHVIRDSCSNAVEAMAGREGRRLTVRARHDPIENRVDVEISDTGAGIPDEVRDRLFALGVSTKESKLGIGLWYSRMFMRATGGNIVLGHTSPGAGTTFVIQIPCPEPVGPGDGRRVAARQTPPSVLIVEDTASWRDRLAEMLSDRGYSIHTTASYREAQSTLGTRRFALAVIDIRLTDGDDSNRDGLRLLEDMDRLGLTTRVIIVTAHTDKRDDGVLARHANRIHAIVSKARFDVTAFRALVDQALEA